MASVNRVILIGNLGRDPEVRTTQAGGKIVNMAVATSESWTDKQSGERKERTEWSRVVIMNDHLADVAEKYARKGAQVYVMGSLQTRKWTDKDGQERYTTEVLVGRFNAEFHVLSGRPEEGSPGEAPPARPPARQAPRKEAPSWGASRGGDLDDAIPF